MNMKDIINSDRFKKLNPNWAREDLRGVDLRRVDLRGVDLRRVDLRGAYLSGANLRWANLSEANLREANLREADLRRVDLSGVDLSGADLRWANLSEADLREADLSGANLRWANLSEADLRRVDLSGVDLSGADLRWANLSEADLRRVDLSGVDLSGAQNVPYHYTFIVPNEGDIFGWKMTRQGIVKLLIPKDAKRSSATTRKCRAEFAVVLEMPPGVKVATSLHDSSFEYKLGETVRPTESFDTNRWNECGSGIHFYVTRDEAEQH